MSRGSIIGRDTVARVDDERYSGQLFGADPGAGHWRDLVGHPEQVAGVELLELLDGDARGVRVARVRTGEIDVDILVDRALDISRASVRGVPVGWLSPAGIRHAAFAEPHGLGPLRTFTGGLLTTCGLDHVHAPADEPDRYGPPGGTVRHHPLHGRIAAAQARLTRLDREGSTLVIEGEVRQAMPFGEHLVLRRRLEADLGGRTLRIRDRVRNDGQMPSPLAVLYHLNVGWPVVSPRARVTATVGEPAVRLGSAGQRDWRHLPEPEPAAVEAVWEHTLRRGDDGWCRAAVVTDDIGDGRAAGLLVSWDAATLPHLAQWLMPAPGMYVTAVEPSTVGVGGVAAAREAGTLRMLEPDEDVLLSVDLRLLHGSDDVAAAPTDR